jgi:hypothetical protein
LELLGGCGGGWWSAKDGLKIGGAGVGDVGMVVLKLLVLIGMGMLL